MLLRGDDGTTDSNRLQARVHDAAALAYAFDLLVFDGTDTQGLPLIERNATLTKLLRKAYGHNKGRLRQSRARLANGDTFPY